MRQSGEGPIELKFDTALPDNITVIIYGTFRGIVGISYMSMVVFDISR